ncbi:MAG TPA: MFS transporter [Acidimicrobiales bacterium]|jgi:MFS family permease|nr:MFS transporter [Acidimicrobiales bacterium]
MIRFRKGQSVGVTAAKVARVGTWPMWVLGLAVMIDNIDQYIVRGTSNQIEKAFGVGDFQIGILFSAFIVVNGLATMPASYLGDRWSRTRIMAITILGWSVVSALGGVVPAGAFGLLVVMRGALGFGQAVTDPSGSSLLADFYGIDRRGRAYSMQQCLIYVGLGLGLAIGSFFGTHFGSYGWRLAFGVSILPGLLIAYFCWRLPEPQRGSADRAHVTQDEEMEVAAPIRQPLFPDGVARFLSDMVRGLRTDVKTILGIPTLRYALVGVSSILFVVTAVASWMPTLYERQFHLSQGSANLAFGMLVIVAGIPGTLVGGLMADRWINRFLGARVVIPGVCLMISGALFMISFIPMPFGGAFALQMLAFLSAASAVPALRAGLSDSVPAHLRGTGFGAFNVASIVFGAAAAPLVTSAVASQFGGNYRVAFALVMPITFVGAAFLLAARRHIEKDTAKIFEAVVAAMAAEDAGL